LNSYLTHFEKGRPNHTKAELNAVALMAKVGNPSATHELGVLMQPFVLSYVKSIRGDYSSEARNDIVLAAWLGVWEALERWNPDEGTKFNTYAHWWIRGEVQRWLAGNSGVLSVPREAWANARRIERIVYDDTEGAVVPAEMPDSELASVSFPVGSRGAKRSVKSAGDLFRARQAPYASDDLDSNRSAQSAEEDYMEETHDIDKGALAALGLMRAALVDDDNEVAFSLALDFIDEYELPIAVAERMLEEAQA